jgi:hypothetical protein
MKLIDRIRQGQLPLNEATARELITETIHDGKVSQRDLDEVRLGSNAAPLGTAYGRQIAASFVEVAQSALDRQNNVGALGLIVNAAIDKLEDKLGSVIPRRAAYATAKSLTQDTLDGARYRSIGEPAFRELVKKYGAAYYLSNGSDTQTSLHVANDVREFYLQHIWQRPLDENDPLAALRKYLDENYAGKSGGPAPADATLMCWDLLPR